MANMTFILTCSCRWSIYRPPYFQLSETHKNKKKHFLGFSFLPGDHYNLNLSSGEKVNPQRCFICSYETWEVGKQVDDCRPPGMNGLKYIDIKINEIS